MDPVKESHECDFCLIKGMVYKCSVCSAVHECGSDVCEHLFYNCDYTSVCKLTGRCFEQRHCETYINTDKGLTNTEVPMYFPRVKRDQQVKNRTMDHRFISKLISQMEISSKLGRKQTSDAISKIVELWSEFVKCAISMNVYIHRKDRRCFVVAIIFSLYSGICSPAGYIVNKHPGFELYKLNKKRSYGCFKVSDIRYGQKLIMKVFKEHKPVNVLDINPK